MTDLSGKEADTSETGGGQSIVDFDEHPIGRKTVAPPPPEAGPAYDPSKLRENVRSGLAAGIAAFTCLIAIMLLISAFHGRQIADINSLSTAFLAPFLGLAGTVLGFYFGGKNSSN